MTIPAWIRKWFGIRIRLVAYAREWWRLWSIRLGAVGVTLAGWLVASPDAALSVWASLPAEMRGFIPSEYMPFIGLAIAVLGLFARLVKQEKVTNGTTQDDQPKP